MRASRMTPEETKTHLHVPQVHQTQREGKVHFTLKPTVLTLCSLPFVSCLNTCGCSSPLPSALITMRRLLLVGGGAGSNHLDYLLCLALSSTHQFFHNLI